MKGSICYYLIVLVVMGFVGEVVAMDQETAPEMPKVERVKPLSPDPLERAPGVFFYENLERIADIKDSFHDIGRSDGRFRISMTDVFSGTKSIQQTYIPESEMQGDPGDAGWGWRFFGDNHRIQGEKHNVVVARWYHKFEEGFTPRDGHFPPKMARMRCFSGEAWRGVYTVLFWISGADGHLSIERHTRAPDAHREWSPNHTTRWCFSQPENVGRWIHFELRVALGEGKRSDQIQAWADGVLICDVTGDDLAAGYKEFTLNGMSWDCYWNGGSPREQSRFYDDLMLSTEPIGPARTGFNPVIVKSSSQSQSQRAWQIEVAQGAQKPLVVEQTVDGVVTRYQPPELDYTVVWKGEVVGDSVEAVVNVATGEFVGLLKDKDRLDANTLYFVRVRQQDMAGNWSAWSNWHAGFATTWAEGTQPADRTAPKGYLLGNGMDF